MNIAAPMRVEPIPLEPGPLRSPAPFGAPKSQACELCACLIEDFETLVYVRAAELAAQWEAADPRDRWRHTGAPPPPALDGPSAPARPYRTPQATIDAFWCVVRLADPGRLAAWLDDHPKDEFLLLNLLENK